MRPEVVADESREYRQRYTEEWLSSHCVSSMDVVYNSSSDHQCFDSESEMYLSSEISSLDQSRQGMEANMNDNRLCNLIRLKVMS